ncbi:MAG: SLBB domain-containing protein, partial [Nitrospirota bacterium]
IFDIWDLVQDRKVNITGAINSPGSFAWAHNMHISDLLKLSGGLKRYAYVREAELTRVTPTPEGPKTEKIMVALEKALGGDPAYDIPLKEDDYLFVRAVPEWELYRIVDIKGEVRFPGTYTIKKGEILSSLIERAGGFTDKAYSKGATFTRESVKELQQRQMNDAIDRLEQQLLSQSAGTIESALTPEAGQQQKTSMEQRQNLISKMRATKAKGRITIQLDELQKFKGSPSDLALEGGDILIIPERPQQVQVVGAVYNPTAFIYDPKAKVSTYLKQSGDVTTYADKNEIYILKVDGSAVSKRNDGFWSSLESSRLDPGDTIVVPEKLERIAWMREIKDITQILYQIAVTAGVIIVAF